MRKFLLTQKFTIVKTYSTEVYSTCPPNSHVLCKCTASPVERNTKTLATPLRYSDYLLSLSKSCNYYHQHEKWRVAFQDPFLQTWINFNPSMDNNSYIHKGMWWSYIFILKIQRLHHWRLLNSCKGPHKTSSTNSYIIISISAFVVQHVLENGRPSWGLLH